MRSEYKFFPTCFLVFFAFYSAGTVAAAAAIRFILFRLFHFYRAKTEPVYCSMHALHLHNTYMSAYETQTAFDAVSVIYSLFCRRIKPIA